MSQNFSIETKIETLFLISYFSLSKKRNGTLGTRISHLSYCPLIWLFHSRNMKHYIKRIHESMVAHLVQNSCFCIQRKMLLFRETFFYSEEVLSYSEKHFHIQRKFYIQWISLYFKKISYSKKCYYVQWLFLLYSDKFFIFRKEFVFEKAFHIQIKSLCSEKNFISRKNHKFKFQIVSDTVVGFWLIYLI